MVLIRRFTCRSGRFPTVQKGRRDPVLKSQRTPNFFRGRGQRAKAGTCKSTVVWIVACTTSQACCQLRRKARLGHLTAQKVPMDARFGQGDSTGNSGRFGPTTSIPASAHQHLQDAVAGMSSGDGRSSSVVNAVDAVDANLGRSGVSSTQRSPPAAAAAAAGRERRTSALSTSSSSSRRNSGSHYRYPSSSSGSPPVASTAAFARAEFAASPSSTGTSTSSNMSTLQGIEAQLQIPPFRGGPNAQRTHSQPYNPAVSGSASSSNAGSRSTSGNIGNMAEQTDSASIQQRLHASYNPQSTAAMAVAGLLTPPSSSSGQLPANNAYLYSSHQPSGAVQHHSMYIPPHTSAPGHRQGAPLPQGVVSSAATTSAVNASNRNRASHQIMPVSAGQAHASTPVNIALHTSQYNVSGQRKVCFGDYQLLHTLGEGEFGKVKLGVHKHRWGEEVAIKLIKKGSIENSARSMKVQREIEVLKVRLPMYLSIVSQSLTLLFKTRRW